MSQQKARQKSLKDRQQREKSSLENLEKLREMFRKEAENAVMQIKENQMMSLEEIREAEDLFENVQEANLFLKKRNQERKKKNKPAQDNHQIPQQKDSKQDKPRPTVQQPNPKPPKKSKQKPKQAPKQKPKQTQKQKQKKPISAPKFDQKRKWNQILENPKTGKFEPEQKRILAESLSHYLLDNNLDIETVRESIMASKEDKKPNNLRMWTIVCSVLPNRTLHSSYTYLVRSLSRQKTNSKWTKEEEERLLALTEKYGHKWQKIGRKLGRTGQTVRDKHRNLCKKPLQSPLPKNSWKIQQLLTLLKQIQSQSHQTFLKPNITSLLLQSTHHNNQQKQQKQLYKYNSKFMLSHNNVQVLDYIDANGLGEVDRGKIRWKEISEKIGTRSQLDCKNKYLQFMEILNRDYRGTDQRKVIGFLRRQENGVKGFTQSDVRWDLWNEDEGVKQAEAKCKWLMIKKKIRNRANKSFKQLLQEAQVINQRKLSKNEKRFQKIKQREEQRKKRRQQQKNKKQGSKDNPAEKERKEVQMEEQVERSDQRKEGADGAVMMMSLDEQNQVNNQGGNQLKKVKKIRKQPHKKPSQILKQKKDRPIKNPSSKASQPNQNPIKKNGLINENSQQSQQQQHTKKVSKQPQIKKSNLGFMNNK